jgi:predicted RNase H-like HicB family nuclease
MVHCPPSRPSASVKPLMAASEIIFEVRQDEIDGGYTAQALGHSIFTEADSLEELRKNVQEAADCHFGDDATAPRIIRLHFVRDEVLVR